MAKTAEKEMPDLTGCPRVKKNRLEDVVVRETTFKGHKLVDARVIERAITPNGQPIMTRKGLTLTKLVWRELLPFIHAVVDPPEGSGDEADKQA
jgi:hypothetical protein